MRDVRWAPLARRDIDKIDAYYRDIAPDIADRMGKDILAAAALLSDSPFIGPVAAYGERRKWTVARTPYIIFYRVATTHIRVLHSKMDQRRH